MTIKAFLKKYDLTGEVVALNFGASSVFVELSDSREYYTIYTAAARAGLLWENNPGSAHALRLQLMEPSTQAAYNIAAAAEAARLESFWQARHAENTATA